MMPLSFATTGHKSRIKKVGGREEAKRHMCNLGFVEGSIIEVVSETGGNLIVNIKDTRVAISKEMANRIVVEEIEAESVSETVCDNLGKVVISHS